MVKKRRHGDSGHELSGSDVHLLLRHSMKCRHLLSRSWRLVACNAQDDANASGANDFNAREALLSIAVRSLKFELLLQLHKYLQAASVTSVT
jgi:hypothetical protein